MNDEINYIISLVNDSVEIGNDGHINPDWHETLNGINTRLFNDLNAFESNKDELFESIVYLINMANDDAMAMLNERNLAAVFNPEPNEFDGNLDLYDIDEMELSKLNTINELTNGIELYDRVLEFIVDHCRDHYSLVMYCAKFDELKLARPRLRALQGDGTGDGQASNGNANENGSGNDATGDGDDDTGARRAKRLIGRSVNYVC